MRNLKNELKNKTINYEKLLEYGFIKEDEKYIYKAKICSEQLEMIVEVKQKQISSKLMDFTNEDEYILVDIQDAARRVCRESKM